MEDNDGKVRFVNSYLMPIRLVITIVRDYNDLENMLVEYQRFLNDNFIKYAY